MSNDWAARRREPSRRVSDVVVFINVNPDLNAPTQIS
jgi:hypothetical protein